MKLPTLSCLLLLIAGCHTVNSGTDASALGYSSSTTALTASGYHPNPVTHPAPTPWTPPPRRAKKLSLDDVRIPPPTSTLGTAPIPYLDEVTHACEHLTSLPTPRSAQPLDRDACLSDLRVARLFRNHSDWRELLACVEATQALSGLGSCEAARPLALTSNPEYPRESVTCLHVFALTLVEELGAEPMLTPPQFAEFQPLLAGCIQTFVDEREPRGPEGYVKMLDCVDVAPSTAAAEACE